MKRLSPEQVGKYLIGHTCIGSAILSDGSLGIIFDGDRILSMRGQLLDQAESVAELTRIRAAMQYVFIPDVQAKPKPMPTHRDQGIPPGPDVVDAGGMEQEAPVFKMPWTSEPRPERAPRRTIQIDGWEENPDED